jgi:hypothetical protein
MPWAKPIFNEVGLVSTRRCCVCTIIGRKENNLVARWDLIEKHIGERTGFDGILMVNGPWIQNVCMLKTKSLRFSFL